jgi:N-acetylglucosaminyldiphosphoundecaprenol N-acetyl-beta-D-mannosaminyltransferase
VANVHTVVTGLWDPLLRQAQEGAAFSVPDGRPLYWAARLKGYGSARQVRGPALMRESLRMGVGRRVRHFFFGGDAGVAEAAAKRMEREIPGLRVAGTESPPFRALTAGEERRVQAKLRRAKVEVLWVGLGAPKQERWMEAHRTFAPVMTGVGAAFDYFAGTHREAPPWAQRMGLEWLVRLAQQPRRLAWRYLSTNPVFAVLFAGEYFGLCYNLGSAWSASSLKWLGLAVVLAGFQLRLAVLPLAWVAGFVLAHLGHRLDRWNEGNG